MQSDEFVLYANFMKSLFALAEGKFMEAVSCAEKIPGIDTILIDEAKKDMSSAFACLNMAFLKLKEQTDDQTQ